MKEKYNQKYEDQIRKLAADRFDKKNFRVFDHNARIIKRVNIPELVNQGKTAHTNCLVIVNGEGERLLSLRSSNAICAKRVKAGSKNNI